MSLTQVNAVEQFFPVVLFVIFYKVVLIFECVHKVRSNESYAAQDGTNARVWEWNLFNFCLGVLQSEG